MLRRITLSSGLRAATAVRCYTPPEDLKKLYGSKFEDGAFPLNIVPGDSTMFAKFLYKSAEPKSAFDVILKDFDAIATASTKLPVFWERTANIESMPEFKSLSPATTFTLVWMENNGMLDLIPSVRDAFETYVNAQRKKAVVKIFVADAKDTKAVSEAKKVAEELHKSTKDLNGFTLEFKTLVDNTFVSGFAVELAGQFVNQAKGVETNAAKSSDDVDYTNVPAPKISKTVWDDNVETEVLRKYVEQMALYDAEEAKTGF